MQSLSQGMFSQIQRPALDLQLCCNPTEMTVGHPGLSLVYLSLSAHLKTSYIVIISLCAREYLHSLFPKHGASDAKRPSRTAGPGGLLWQ